MEECRAELYTAGDPKGLIMNSPVPILIVIGNRERPGLGFLGDNRSNYYRSSTGKRHMDRMAWNLEYAPENSAEWIGFQ